MESELTHIVTKSREEADGEVWGIKGKLIWIFVPGLMLSLAFFGLFFVELHMPPLIALLLASPPVGLAGAYVMFKQNTPPAYGEDLVDTLVGGRAIKLYRRK